MHGNYLRSSIVAAGLDPENLPQSDKSKMNFGSGGNTDKKAWRDIWGAGQGVGQIADVPTVGELVDRLEREYMAARRELNVRSRKSRRREGRDIRDDCIGHTLPHPSCLRFDRRRQNNVCARAFRAYRGRPLLDRRLDVGALLDGLAAAARSRLVAGTPDAVHSANVWTTASQLAARGVPCVFDLGFSTAQSRADIEELATAAGFCVQLHFIECPAPADERWLPASRRAMRRRM